MNTAMKQRLVGTVVIGCLAIIFIPALLDGEGVSPPEMTSSMPAPPAMPEVPVIQQERPEITADTLSASEPDADEQAAAPHPRTLIQPLLRLQRRKDQSSTRQAFLQPGLCGLALLAKRPTQKVLWQDSESRVTRALTGPSIQAGGH